MSTIERDLWPADIEEVDLVAPVAILKSQASRLRNHTRRLITADVVSTGNTDRFDHGFYIRARALRYETLLFTVTHGIELYPLIVVFEGLPQGQATADTEDRFAEVLETVFSHPTTQRLIKSLLAQLQT